MKNTYDYKEVWTKMLGVFLHWMPKQVEEWSMKWADGLEHGNNLFYHERASWYVVPLLIPGELAEKLDSIGYNKLEGEILLAIQSGNLDFETDPDFDWFAAKGRVEYLLDTYAKRLNS